MSTVRLSREVRIGLHETAEDGGGGGVSSNGFAGNPMLAGIAPYLAVTVTVSGPIDPQTGMLVNIKVIDAVVREHAIELLRMAFLAAPLRTADTTLKLFDHLAPHLNDKSHTLEAIDLALSPYLHIAVMRQEKPMVQLSQRFEFSAAHRLHAASLSDAENREVFGRCNNPNGHGHNYELEVTLTGPANAATGLLIPIADLQKIVNEKIVDVFDHKHLNMDCPEFESLNPTVENIAKVLYGKLKPHIPAPATLSRLRLWETPKTMCEYSEPKV